MKRIIFCTAFVFRALLANSTVPDPFIFITPQGEQFGQDALICKGSIHIIWAYIHITILGSTTIKT